MDNTELHYVTYDPDAVFEAMLTAYLEAGGDTIFGGDEKEMLLRAVQAIIVQAFAGVDNGLRMGTLRYAVGEYLDIIGDTRGCPRKQAVKATLTATITETTDGTASTLEAGTLLTATGEKLYALNEAVSITGTGATHTVRLTCTTAGADGNGLPTGTALQFMLPQDGVATVVTSSDAIGGENTEDDEAYRERIRMHSATLTTTGTALQYESTAKDVSQDVVDAKALNEGAGVVGVYIIVDDDADPTTTVNAVSTKLNDPDYRPLTDTIIVSEADKLTYTINVEYRGETGVDIADSVSSAVATYADWQNNKIGQAFNPDRLMALLYQSGCTRVTWDAGSSFNGGPVQYTEIDARKRCLGTINVRRLN